jgi:hypothetical protein
VNVPLASDVTRKTSAGRSVVGRGSIVIMRYVKPQVNSKSQSRVIFQQDRSRQFAPSPHFLFQQSASMANDRNRVIPEFLRQNQPCDAVCGQPASPNPAHRDYPAFRKHRSMKRRLTEHHHQLSVSVIITSSQ